MFLTKSALSAEANPSNKTPSEELVEIFNGKQTIGNLPELLMNCPVIVACIQLSLWQGYVIGVLDEHFFILRLPATSPKWPATIYKGFIPLRGGVMGKAFLWLFLFNLKLFADGAPIDPTKDMLVSNIEHDLKNNHAHVNFGKISMSDLLPICPMETMPTDLAFAVNALVEHVRNSVSKIKASQTSSCQVLQDRLSSAQGQISSAINYQFVASANISSNANQDKINAQTQQANAVNLLVLTASDMMQHQCIDSIDDRIIIQRLLGQVISLGGLLYGGWQGILIATSGQLMVNLPLFRSELDRALEVFQKYDEINERGSFLCLFRQMQKTSCLMFATGTDTVVNGMDMSLQTGPAKTTMDSVDDIKRDAPNILNDITWFREVEVTTEPFVSYMQKPEALSEGLSKAFEEFRRWCLANSKLELKNAFLHPETVHQAHDFLKETCTDLNSYKYPTGSADLSKLLVKAQWNLLLVSNYYRDLKKDNSSYVASVAKTWESFQYFQNFKKTVQDYQNPLTGNQRRLNYYHLVRSLENSLAKASFTRMMDRNHKTFLETKQNWLPKDIRLSLYDPVLSDRIRKRALMAMIELCQTIDPTLACLYIDTPQQSALHKEWKSRCVGLKSQLCERVTQLGERDKFLKSEPNYYAYFNSLCGFNG